MITAVWAIARTRGLGAREAILRALASLDQQPEHLLIDHLSVPAAGLPETVLTKGDCRSLSIAAASVLAKVSRDAVMVRVMAAIAPFD